MEPNIQHAYDFASPNTEVHKQGHHNNFGSDQYCSNLDHKISSKHTKCYKLNCYQLTSLEFEKSNQEIIWISLSKICLNVLYFGPENSAPPSNNWVYIIKNQKQL